MNWFRPVNLPSTFPAKQKSSQPDLKPLKDMQKAMRESGNLPNFAGHIKKENNPNWGYASAWGYVTSDANKT